MAGSCGGERGVDGFSGREFTWVGWGDDTEILNTWLKTPDKTLSDAPFSLTPGILSSLTKDKLLWFVPKERMTFCFLKGQPSVDYVDHSRWYDVRPWIMPYMHSRILGRPRSLTRPPLPFSARKRFVTAPSAPAVQSLNVRLSLDGERMVFYRRSPVNKPRAYT